MRTARVKETRLTLNERKCNIIKICVHLTMRFMLEERENGMLRQLSMYFLQLQEQIYQNQWKADSFANHEEYLFVKDLFQEREYIRQDRFISSDK
jgi:hypothetical protein